MVVVAIEYHLSFEQQCRRDALGVLKRRTVTGRVDEFPGLLVENVIEEIVAVPVKLVSRVAHRQAAVLTDGVAGVLPRSLAMRRFSPSPASIVLKVGFPAARPSTNAEMFARLLQEESTRRDSES